MLYPQNLASLGALLLLTQASTTVAHPTRHAHRHKHHSARDVGAKHHQIRVPVDSNNSNGRKEGVDGKTFTIRQVKNPRLEGRSAAQRNGLSALIHAYAKYGVEPSPRIKKAMKLNPVFREYQEELEKRGDITATVAAIPPPGNYEYVSPVEIGTPPQTVWMNIDTGSADFWVVSTDTPRYQTRGHAIYDPHTSNTSVLIPDLNWRITYADGSGARGIVYQDRVSIDDVLSFPAQVVQSATSISWDFTTDPYVSGIMGLGMSSGNTVSESIKDVEDKTGIKILTFMDNVREQLAEPVFTANLRDNAEGSYGFGFINETEHVGEVRYVPVKEDGIFWEFEIGGYLVGSEEEKVDESQKDEEEVEVVESDQGQEAVSASDSVQTDEDPNGEQYLTTTSIQPDQPITSSPAMTSMSSDQDAQGQDQNTLLETTNSTAIPRSINSHTINQRISYPFTTIADTGTTLLLLPDSIVSDYYSAIPGASYSSEWAGYLFPCSYASSLPDWSFFLGSAPPSSPSTPAPNTTSSDSNKAEPKLDIGPEPEGDRQGQGQEEGKEGKEEGFYYKGTVPGRYMNYGEVNATWCYGGMQSSEDIGFSIFGDVVLKAQFVVFDLGGMRVGFAGKELEEGVGKGEVNL
ncbi:aspartic peptidase domain-containing protein [Pseudoneurospora amorphoporcata]|uniref:Aspartic peptidase domain-containing protein n=1 Tax=Pseudoneurospora amorphoporcata TaxID=241081 RepID=A0AAN6NWK4_9PEZI|nr:aspartic peptidase domain-containing protein [Pseudoneurospora amorphoporcata]